MKPVFLDTNVLLYSISRDDAEAPKRERAIELLERDDCAISAQVLQEFYVQATRPSRAHPVPHELAAGLMRAWSRCRVQETTGILVHAALDLKARYGFAYWDAAIVAAALAQGCSTLFTEDLPHEQVVEGVRIVDPFR